MERKKRRLGFLAADVHVCNVYTLQNAANLKPTQLRPADDEDDIASAAEISFP